MINEVEAPEKAEPEKVNPKPKKKAVKKPRARKVEDLIDEATRKMTDKEKDLLISFLREDTNRLKSTIDALKQNIETAYKQCRELESQYESMEKFYRESLMYVDNQVVAFANAVRKATVGGKN